MTVDYAGYLLADWELNDDLQNVSLVNTVTSETVENVKAKGRALNYREASLGSSIGLEPTDQVFMLGCLSLGEVAPNRGDQIVEADGTVWVIMSVSVYDRGGTPIYYDVVVRRQV